MVELVQENWLLIVLALLVGLAVAWWIFAATRRTRVQVESRDQAEAAPARRNQALIDAPPAAAAASEIPPAAPPGMAGAGAAAVEAEPTTAPPVGMETGEGPLGATILPTPEAEEPAAPPPAPPPASAADELLRIKGLGPKLADHLRALGVSSLAQIAAWDDAEIDRIDAQLGRFQGRIRRDDWPEQARLLTAGDLAAYEAKFGKV